MIIRVLLTSFLLLAPLFAEPLCFFIPPSNWEIAQPKDERGPLEVGFVNPSRKARITLATEKGVGSSLKDYVLAVKGLQQADPAIKEWRDLGTLKMEGGTGELIEMHSATPMGDIRIMQAILVKNDTAYILTASTLKKEFGAIQSEVFETFHSLKVIPELTTPVKDKATLKKLFSSLKPSSSELKRLEKELKNYSELGSYWKFLALKEGAAQIETRIQESK
jgi:hypothetical protein